MGGGVHGLSTAINIQENIPNVEVEVLIIDQGTTETNKDSICGIRTSCIEPEPNQDENNSYEYVFPYLPLGFI